MKKEIFENIPGNSSLKKTLQKILKSNNIPHALLFSGKKGIGKFAFALEIIKYLNSKDSKATEGTIAQINRLQKPFVNYIFPLPRNSSETPDDAPFAKLKPSDIQDIQTELLKKSRNPYYQMQIEKAQNIKISSIRELKKDIAMAKGKTNYSAIIIDGVETMSVPAQNSLLKSLEEPPERTVFILLTEDSNFLLPTIISRCWTFNFNPLSNEELHKVLINYFKYSDEEAEAIIPFAEGTTQNAVELNKFSEENIIDSITNFFRYAISKNYHSAFNYLKETLKVANNNLDFVIHLIKLWLNDVEKNRNKHGNYSFKSLSEIYSKLNNSYPNSNLQKIQTNLDKYLQYSKMNVSLKIILLNIIFEVSSISKR